LTDTLNGVRFLIREANQRSLRNKLNEKMVRKNVLTAAGVLSLAAILVLAVAPVAFAGKNGNGNGAPSGAHYNLNLIGVPKDKTADMTGNNGHRIFVKLTGGTKIMLAEGDFQVLDANGTDGSAAFQLPLPAECYATVDPDTGDVVTPDSCTVRYTVWIRALGKPGGSMDMYTCAEDPDLPGGYICSDPDWWVDVTRTNGQSKFTNVSKELLFVSTNVDDDPAIEHVQIFDPLFDDYYWQVDNQGLRLAQMRFYMGDYTINW